MKDKMRPDVLQRARLYAPCLAFLLCAMGCDSSDRAGRDAGGASDADASDAEKEEPGDSGSRDALCEASTDGEARDARTANVCPEASLDPSAVHFQSATQLATSIREGELTSVGLLDVFVDRIESLNGEINAVV